MISIISGLMTIGFCVSASIFSIQYHANVTHANKLFISSEDKTRYMSHAYKAFGAFCSSVIAAAISAVVYVFTH